MLSFVGQLRVFFSHKSPTPSVYPTCGGISARNRVSAPKTLKLQITSYLLSLFTHVDGHDQTLELKGTLQND